MRLIKPYKQANSASSNIKLRWVLRNVYTLTINYQWRAFYYVPNKN